MEKAMDSLTLGGEKRLCPHIPSGRVSQGFKLPLLCQPNPNFSSGALAAATDILSARKAY